MKTGLYTALWISILTSPLVASLPPEVEALIEENEAARLALPPYAYHLDYTFLSYDPAAPGVPSEKCGHRGSVMANGAELRCDLITYSSLLTTVHPNGEFRNLLVRNGDYTCWVQRIPEAPGDPGNVAMACLYDFADANDWPDTRKAMEGSRSFDLIPYAFGFDRFSTLRQNLEDLSGNCIFTVQSTKAGKEIRVTPRDWKGGASVVLRFSAAYPGILESKTFYTDTGTVVCQTDIAIGEIDGVPLPLEVRDRRYKLDASASGAFLFREFVAQASDVSIVETINDAQFRVSSLGLPNEQSIGWYLPGDRVMKHGLRINGPAAEPVARDEEALVDSEGFPSGVDREIRYQ